MDLYNDDPTDVSIRTISEAHRRFGTTNFLPTLITTSTEKMIRAINAVGQAMQQPNSGILGLHIEGPYINESKAGVHNGNLLDIM